MSIILATAHADGARLDPQEYLGPRFNAYREAASGAGARYVSAIRTSVIAIDRLPALRQALTPAGFELAVDEGLRNSLAAAAEDAAARATEGNARLSEAESRLRDGVSLFKYQREGVRWLAPRRAALLADEMGLGKTVQALMALPANARALVIAPSAVAANWIRETVTWRPDLRPVRIASRKNFRWPAAGEVLVGTYGSLPAEDQELAMPHGDMIVIADEGHLLKGSAGRKLKDGTVKGGVRRVRRWQVVRDAAHASNGRVWILTGTPLLNRPTELWRVIEAAGAGMGDRVFGGWGNFNQLLRTCRGSHVEESSEMSLALQKVMLRRDRAAVLPDLPRKRRQVESTRISDGPTLAACDELVRVLADAGKSPEDLLEMGKLPATVRKVVFEKLSKLRAALAAAKTPRALEIAQEYEEQGLPVVAFSAHLAPLKALAKRKGWGIIVGDVNPEQRAETVRKFQAGELNGIACSFDAGGVGITLTRAHHVLCVDQPWTPALLQQAEDRCCRIGQEADSVHVRILAADHAVDLRVAELLCEKTRLIEATVEAAAVAEVAPDDAMCDRAQALAEMAASTSEVADKAKLEQDKREADMKRIRDGQADRERGVFAVGAVPDNGTKRGPRNAVEVHAASAMVRLAELDPDRARDQNEMGFSAFDGEFGHSLAKQLIQWGRLSDRQWSAAARMARRYRRQVGEPPAAS